MLRFVISVLVLTVFLAGCSSEGGDGASTSQDSAAAVVSVPSTPAAGDIQFNGNDPMYSEITVALTRTPSGALKVGDEVTLTFKATSNPDWHLYSSRKDGNIAYNPTELALFSEECKGIELVGEMSEDKTAQEREDKLLGGLVRDFAEHDVTYSQKLKITGTEVVLAAELAGQVCTNKGMCKFFKFPVDWTFTAQP